jgi:phosphate transport system protein
VLIFGYNQYMRQLGIGIEELRRELSRMGSLVEAAVSTSAQSLGMSDARLVQDVIANETAINHLEMEIDDRAIRLLALYQPVACDLRFLTATLKMTTDLERMGDLAANIVRRAAGLGPLPVGTESLDQILEMADYVGSMVSRSIDSFAKSDSRMASQVLKDDDVADRYLAAITGNLFAVVSANPAFAETAFELMFVARHLERIADHATNIAEDVLYLLSGVDVRHMSQVA